jgi:hypothetical protein
MKHGLFISSLIVPLLRPFQWVRLLILLGVSLPLVLPAQQPIQKYREEIQRLRNELTDRNKEIIRLKYLIETLEHDRVPLEKDKTYLIRRVQELELENERLREQIQRLSPEGSSRGEAEIQRLRAKSLDLASGLTELHARLSSLLGALMEQSLRVTWTQELGGGKKVAGIPLDEVNYVKAEAVDHIYVQFDTGDRSSDEDTHYLTIADAKGQPVYGHRYVTFSVRHGRAKFRFPVSLAPGQYYLKIHYDKGGLHLLTSHAFRLH